MCSVQPRTSEQTSVREMRMARHSVAERQARLGTSMSSFVRLAMVLLEKQHEPLTYLALVILNKVADTAIVNGAI